MFISNWEKDQIKLAIEVLQERVRNLESFVAKTKKRSAAQQSTLRTKEAPWGYKMDGTPKKRPGIQPKTQKVTP